MQQNSTESVLSQMQRARAVGDLVRVNLLVPATLRKEWKGMALASDMTLTEYIIEAMQHQINRTKQSEIVTK